MEIDLTFKTYDEFEAYRAQWERDTQQVFVKAKSRKFEHGVKERDTIVYKAVTFACVHGKDRPSESDGDRPFQHTKKKGCPVVFQLMGSKKSGTLSVRIAPDISPHSHTLTETCQRQVKLNCGIHAIAMAVSFAMGGDPSAARLSHELMTSDSASKTKAWKYFRFQRQRKGSPSFNTRHRRTSRFLNCGTNWMENLLLSRRPLKSLRNLRNLIETLKNKSTRE